MGMMDDDAESRCEGMETSKVEVVSPDVSDTEPKNDLAIRAKEALAPIRRRRRKDMVMTGDVDQGCENSTELSKEALASQDIPDMDPMGALVGSRNGVGPVWKQRRKLGTDEIIPTEYACEITSTLHILANALVGAQRARIAQANRGADILSPEFAALVDVCRDAETVAEKLLTRALRRHPLWPWLKAYPGLGGVHTAQIIGRMRTPWRFPSPRALFGYLGLHVLQGKMPRWKRGDTQRQPGAGHGHGPWNSRARTSILQPGGIAEHIVRNRVAPYRAIYDQAKARLIATRLIAEAPTDDSEYDRGNPSSDEPNGAERRAGMSDQEPGAMSQAEFAVRLGKTRRRANLAETGIGVAERARGKVKGRKSIVGADGHCGSLSDAGTGAADALSLLHIERIARIIAAKAFVADLWRAWRVVAPHEEAQSG